MNFRNYFWSVWAEFSGLFSNSPDKVLGMNIANFWDWFRAVSNWVEI